jgi:mannose-6-phosphate isomerase-like protein (cupin superfamily)
VKTFDARPTRAPTDSDRPTPVIKRADEVDYETLSAGDSLLIPAGTVHWFHNEGDGESAFVCMVPNGDADIELVDGA